MSVRFWSCLKVVGFLLLLGSFLPGVEAAQARPAKLSVEYIYASDGMLTGRTVNGQIQRFEYDKRGQLLAVKDAQGNDLERYVYDPAGNILSKTVHGRTTRFTYDAANQITSRTNPDGRVIQYQYDAAGRLIQEGTRSYVYGWQDKVEEIRENGKTIAKFTYGLDGQLESVTRADGREENFYWDGLALIGHGKSTFLNEPYVTGGNPIASDGKAMLNDMLGSTVGICDGEKMTPVSMTAFGESSDSEAMYTGKPYVDGLGYAFLFRTYRAELGKWQTADPLGYLDGWNSFAYVNNHVIEAIDWLGAVAISDFSQQQFYAAPVWQIGYVPPQPLSYYDSVEVRGNDLVQYQITATADGNDSGITGIQVSLNVTSAQSFGLTYRKNGQAVWTPSNITGTANLSNSSISQSSRILANGDKEFTAVVTCYVYESASGYNHQSSAPLKVFILTLKHTVAE